MSVPQYPQYPANPQVVYVPVPTQPAPLLGHHKTHSQQLVEGVRSINEETQSGWVTTQLIFMWINAVAAFVLALFLVALYMEYSFWSVILLIVLVLAVMVFEIKCALILVSKTKNPKHLKVILIYRYVTGLWWLMSLTTYINFYTAMGIVYCCIMTYSMYKVHDHYKQSIPTQRV
ncbi:hypothetical protein PCE1_004697 [Barthelona sp. PCE]